MLQFGNFRLDPDRLILWRGDETVPIGPRVVHTLATLVEHQGQVLSKEELIERVWGDTTVEDSNVAHNILILRKLLKNESSGTFIIENIPRRGYRFRELSPSRPQTDPPGVDLKPAATDSDGPRERPRLEIPAGNVLARRGRVRWIVVAGIFSCLLVTAAYFVGRYSGLTSPADQAARNSRQAEQPVTWLDHPAHSKYEFENGEEGWVVRPRMMITRAYSSDEHAYRGKRSLAIVFGGPFTRKSQVYIGNPPIVAGQEVTAHIRCPEQNGLEAIAFFAEDRNDAWNNDWSRVRLARGSWNDFSVHIPADSAPLKRLGVEFTSASPWSGTCYLDSVEW